MGDNRCRKRHCRDRRPVYPTELRLSDFDAIGANCVRLRRANRNLCDVSCWLIPSQDGRQLLSCLIGANRHGKRSFFECCTVYRAVRLPVSVCCPGTGITRMLCVVRRVRSRNNKNIENVAVCAYGRNWDPTCTETACSCRMRQNNENTTVK